MAKIVTLVHNARAGRRTDVDALARALRADGHEVHVAPHDEARCPVMRSTDAVVSVGGDGTLLGVARWLIGQRLPLVAYAGGTANNVARSIGAPATADALRALLNRPEERAFDLGVVHDDDRDLLFAESAGVGWFVDALERSVDESGKRHPTADLTRHLNDYRPAHRHVELDGRDESGAYVGVEIMNVPMMGPNLCLAHEADPHDGRLDVVLIGEAERRDVARRLLRRDAAGHAPLAVRRASRVRFRVAPGEPLRFDGRIAVRASRFGRDVVVEVLRGAVSMWVGGERPA